MRTLKECHFFSVVIVLNTNLDNQFWLAHIKWYTECKGDLYMCTKIDTGIISVINHLIKRLFIFSSPRRG